MWFDGLMRSRAACPGTRGSTTGPAGTSCSCRASRWSPGSSSVPGSTSTHSRPKRRQKGCGQLADGRSVRLRGPEGAGGLDRGAEVQALVLGLLDQHHGLERFHVVDALLLALGRDLGLVRPVVELHLRDPGDLAHLTEIELDLLEVLGKVHRLQKINVSADCHHVLISIGG